MLTPSKQHAAALLSVGTEFCTVAKTVGICRMTLLRWRREPEFQQALEQLTQTMVAGILSHAMQPAPRRRMRRENHVSRNNVCAFATSSTIQ